MELKIGTILQKEFNEKSSRNNLYSIRAFARDIGIGKSTLHEILNKNKKVSKATCTKILSYLNYSDTDFQQILNYNTNPTQDILFKKLSNEEFNRIATCEHYVILSLSQSKSCPSNLLKLSQRIMLPEEETKQLVKDLLELNLIAIEEEKIVRTSKLLTTSYDIPSQTIKDYHKSSLDKVKLALSDIEVELRDIASTTFLMSPEKMNSLKEELKAIRRKIVSSVEDNKEDSEAFLINISVIPVSRRN
jgi:uncharacterized protein (TIGR02147 family)